MAANQPHLVGQVTRKCYDCGGVMEGTCGNYKYTECGLQSVRLVNVPLFNCKRCGAVVPEIPAVSDLHRTIAFSLITKDSLLIGEEIRFLRKMAGLSGVELSQLLGTHKTNLSKWENNKRPITKKADSALRLLSVAAMFQDLFKGKTEIVPKVADIARKLSAVDLTQILQHVKEIVTGPKQVIIDPTELYRFGVEEPLSEPSEMVQ